MRSSGRCADPVVQHDGVAQRPTASPSDADDGGDSSLSGKVKICVGRVMGRGSFPSFPAFLYADWACLVFTRALAFEPVDELCR
jgi:hypothetical protein